MRNYPWLLTMDSVCKSTKIQNILQITDELGNFKTILYCSDVFGPKYYVFTNFIG